MTFSKQNAVPVEVGDIIESECEGIGSKGDGIFKTGEGFVVIVPNAQIGDRSRIRITRVLPTVSFGELVHEDE